MHEHSGCEHELKYCSCCDVVYCVKCNREWKQTSRWEPCNIWDKYRNIKPPTITYTCDHT